MERSYTPVDTLEASRKRNGLLPPGKEGETIELMVKLYRDGKMSSFLSNLKEGRQYNLSCITRPPPSLLGPREGFSIESCTYYSWLGLKGGFCNQATSLSSLGAA